MIEINEMVDEAVEAWISQIEYGPEHFISILELLESGSKEMG